MTDQWTVLFGREIKTRDEYAPEHYSQYRAYVASAYDKYLEDMVEARASESRADMYVFYAMKHTGCNVICDLLSHGVVFPDYHHGEQVDCLTLFDDWSYF